MRSIHLCACALCCCMSFTVIAQVSYNANQQVTPYTGTFRFGVNMGYYAGWDNQSLSDVAAGNTALNIPGVGARSNRVGLLEYVMDYFGYNLVVGDFHHWNQVGMGEYVAFIGGPTSAHQDMTQYCPGRPSYMFANLYTPIWDGGANGTPYNDNNYCAAYLYKLVTQYKGKVRFWEIWNEPGYDFTGNLGWRGPDYPGNWWQEGPNPCDNILQAPIYNYTRTLRIAWEIIKTVDPNAYVCLGSVGFPSFMNALLRNTDNPNGGDVSPEYPLGGGAYFDCIAIHSYPHFDGSTVNPDEGLYERHSDQAADGILKARQDFQNVLNQYGYDGVTYPRKEWISTEVNSPRKALTSDCFAGKDAQINHMMKVQMVAKANGIRQLHAYQLFDHKTEQEALDEFDLMGMYAKIDGQPAYSQVVHDVGKAMKTTSDLIFNTEYDAQRTAALNLPPGVRGYAWRKPDGSFVYALWARTTEDKSEAATAVYSFPASLQISYCQRYTWDYGYTNLFDAVAPTNIQLTARPTFFTTGQGASPCHLFTTTTYTQCQNRQTINDPDDDTYTVGLMITGMNHSCSWTGELNGQTIHGAVGSTINLGPFPIIEGALAGVVQDAAEPGCATDFLLIPPPPCSVPSLYCQASSDFPWHEWIGGVEVGSIQQTSDKSVYSDFTNQETTVLTGNQYPINLTAGFSWLTYEEYWRVWIDFNQDGVFGADEVACQGIQRPPSPGSPSSVFSGTLHIPANAVGGNTRMRVSMKRGGFAEPCGILLYGEVEDYTIQIIDNGGGTDPVPYCTMQSDFPWHDWIARVQMTTLDNPSGKLPYNDFTNLSATLNQGELTNFFLTTGFSWETFEEYWSIWIDYNHNGLFDVPVERVYAGSQIRPVNGTPSFFLPGSFTVPANAPLGATRMRVIMGHSPQSSACEALPFGEVEDYTVQIVAPTSGSFFKGGGNATVVDRSTTNASDLKGWRVYPNPATDHINIDLGKYGGQEGVIRVYNAQGQQVKEIFLSRDRRDSLVILLEGYPNGTYMVQIQVAGLNVAERVVVAGK